MTYTLTIQLPGLPKGLNGAHGSWRAHAARRKEWREMVCFIAKPRRPKAPLTRCKITCTRFSTTEMDFDNLVASFKPLVDGLKDAGVIVDDNTRVITERQYLWEKAARSGGRVSIQVEEI